MAKEKEETNEQRTCFATSSGWMSWSDFVSLRNSKQPEIQEDEPCAE